VLKSDFGFDTSLLEMVSDNKIKRFRTKLTVSLQVYGCLASLAAAAEQLASSLLEAHTV
jgi:hypothetical protein